MTKDKEIMDFLSEQVFNLVLDNPNAPSNLKSGVNLTVMRMNNLNADGKIRYFWSAISGTDRSLDFADSMRRDGYTTFEDVRE